MKLHFIQSTPCSADSSFTGLLNMPFIKAWQSHRDTFPAEGHGTFQLCFTAGMKCTGTGNILTEMTDHIGIDTCSDQHFRAVFSIPQSNQLFNNSLTSLAIGGRTGGQYCINAKLTSPAVGIHRITGNIDTTVQCNTAITAGFHQWFHGIHIQITIGSQAANDKPICTGSFQGQNLLPHHFQFFRCIEKITGTGTHQATDLNIRFSSDLPKQRFIRSQATGQQRTAQFQPVSTAGNSCSGRSQGIHTDFQKFCHKISPLPDFLAVQDGFNQFVAGIAKRQQKEGFFLPQKIQKNLVAFPFGQVI